MRENSTQNAEDINSIAANFINTELKPEQRMAGEVENIVTRLNNKESTMSTDEEVKLVYDNIMATPSDQRLSFLGKLMNNPALKNKRAVLERARDQYLEATKN